MVLKVYELTFIRLTVKIYLFTEVSYLFIWKLLKHEFYIISCATLIIYWCVASFQFQISIHKSVDNVNLASKSKAINMNVAEQYI